MAKPLPTETLAEFRTRRFWSKIDKRGADECWNWIGPMNRSGYGKFSLWGKADRGRVISAHRHSFEIAYGPIERMDGHHGTVIAHRCDNRRCVNPAHLFACSQAENLRDCLAKNRGNKARGDRAGKAKLTSSMVSVVRSRIREGDDAIALSRDFNVNPQTIRDIAVAATWQHLPCMADGPLALTEAKKGPRDPKPNSGSFKKGCKGNPGAKPEKRTIDYAEAKRLHAQGNSIREVARRMATTHTTVRRALGG